ncbi:MAG: hypothetical protein WC551_08865 [Patescibacteria group bacterium]
MKYQSYDEAWAVMGPKFLAKVEEIKRELDTLVSGLSIPGYELSVYGPIAMDGGDESYTVGVEVLRDEEIDEDLSLDIELTLADAASYDGFDDQDSEWGVNIMMSTVSQAGNVLGNYTPYNYSDRVWTRESEELDQRLDYLEVSEIIYGVEEHLTK